MDPRIVLFDLLSPRLSAAKVRQCLREAGLPLPVRMAIDRFNPVKTGVVQPVATGYAMFEHADDAALAMLALDGTRPKVIVVSPPPVRRWAARTGYRPE